MSRTRHRVTQVNYDQLDLFGTHASRKPREERIRLYQKAVATGRDGDYEQCTSWEPREVRDLLDKRTKKQEAAGDFLGQQRKEREDATWGNKQKLLAVVFYFFIRRRLSRAVTSTLLFPMTLYQITLPTTAGNHEPYGCLKGCYVSSMTSNRAIVVNYQVPYFNLGVRVLVPK